MTTRTRNFRKEEEAVSPVIGVILMVAITVILAAVIGAFVFGMGGSLSRTYTVAATAAQIDADTVDVTFQGGPDADLVSHMNVTIGTNSSAGLFGTVGSTTAVAVGTLVSCTDSTVVTTGRDHVVVAATFMDGTKQVVLDTYV